MLTYFPAEVLTDILSCRGPNSSKKTEILIQLQETCNGWTCLHRLPRIPWVFRTLVEKYSCRMASNYSKNNLFLFLQYPASFTIWLYDSVTQIFVQMKPSTFHISVIFQYNNTKALAIVRSVTNMKAIKLPVLSATFSQTIIKIIW